MNQKAGRTRARIERQIAKMRAGSINGRIAKARCAATCDVDCHPNGDEPSSVFGASIMRDLLALRETTATA